MGGIVLSSRLPVKMTFALLAICPLIVGGARFAIGRLQRRMSQSDETRHDTGGSRHSQRGLASQSELLFSTSMARTATQAPELPQS